MIEGRFRRETGSLEALTRFTSDFFEARGLAPEQRFDVDLIVEELFTNCVKYHPEGAPELTVGLEWTAPVLTIVIRDVGVDDFDITRVAPVDVDAPIEARRAGGLGLHLVRRIADDLRYEYADRTSTLTVTKRLES